ncbi:MAG TPA: thiol reductant ABC exporter subunit CydC [Rubrobacteraceae bacterium]|nr:thiol reductant ABC exporter subunit CydC [Rubrobacteraceae bacterium]
MRTFLRLIRFLGPYRWQVALAVFLGVVTVVSNVGLLATAAYVISAAAIVSYISLLVIQVYLVRIFSVSRSFSRYAERMVSHDVTFRLLGNLRTWFYGRLEPLAPARLAGYRSGDLLSRVVRDVEELENVYLRILAPAAIAAVISAFTFALFYIFSPALAFVALGFLTLTGVGVPILVRTLSRGLGRRELELRAELNARIVDGVQGAQDLLAFGAEGAHQMEIAAVGRKLDRVQRKMAFVTGLRDSLNDLLTNLTMIAALVLTIPLVAQGEIKGVYLGFLALVALGAFEAVQPLGTAFQFLGRSLHAGERLFEISDSEPAVRDPEKPYPAPADHTLEFDRVSFQYEQDETAVLEDISFTLRPGSRIAVVGPSGAGKSTLVNLILRFWDPQGGEVRFGGRDIRDYETEDLRSLVGVVAQDTHVFNASLRENLSLARPGADDTVLKEALERARLSDLVERLPGGLDGYIGEQGARISGGERQRLAVARALLKDAPVLVMDEATANLDPVTERELLESARSLMLGRSTLVITHRLVDMESMDEILVLDGGRIVERGTHAELRGSGDLYSRMLEVQNGMFAARTSGRIGQN